MLALFLRMESKTTITKMLVSFMGRRLEWNLKQQYNNNNKYWYHFWGLGCEWKQTFFLHTNLVRCVCLTRGRCGYHARGKRREQSWGICVSWSRCGNHIRCVRKSRGWCGDGSSRYCYTWCD